MKNAKFFLCLIACVAGTVAYSDPIGEEAGYVLNKSPNRTTLLITGGQGKAVVKEYRDDAFYGPSYLVSLEYSVDIPSLGPEYGSVEFLVPKAVFTGQFFEDFVNVQSVDFDNFKADYLGMANATDHDGNQYDTCYLTRVYDIELGLLDMYDPFLGRRFVLVPDNVTGIFAEMENLEIKLAINQAVPVLGAVQIDISGKSSGLNIKAGFDYTARSLD